MKVATREGHVAIEERLHEIARQYVGRSQEKMLDHEMKWLKDKNFDTAPLQKVISNIPR